MRTQVKQTDHEITVRALTEDGELIGVLTADRSYEWDLHEEAAEVWHEAAHACLDSNYELSDDLQHRLSKFDRCLQALRTPTMLGETDESVFRVADLEFVSEVLDTTSKWDLGAEALEATVKMYRAAAVSAGRRNAPLMAGACTAYGGGIEPSLEAWVWKQPEFRVGMMISGPVASHRSQLALGRASNQRKRRLLR